MEETKKITVVIKQDADTVDGKHAADFALLNGDASQRFKVADAVEDEDAINKKILDIAFEKSIPVGTILEFMLIENGKKINFARDPIDERASSQGFELFCPHSREEYEKARLYLLSIGKPTAMGPLGIYYPFNGPGHGKWDMQNYALNSNEIGSKGWKVQDGSPTWWAADTTSDPTFDRKPMVEPSGDYRANAYLGIVYSDNGYIKHYNDAGSSYSYTTYLCVRRKR